MLYGQLVVKLLCLCIFLPSNKKLSTAIKNLQTKFQFLHTSLYFVTNGRINTQLHLPALFYSCTTENVLLLFVLGFSLSSEYIALIFFLLECQINVITFL